MRERGGLAMRIDAARPGRPATDGTDAAAPEPEASPAGSAAALVAERLGVRYREAVLESVLAAHGLGPTDAARVIAAAARRDDGDRVLRRSELEAAAQRVAAGARAERAQAARIGSYRWSLAELEQVLAAYGLEDGRAVLSTAIALGGRDRVLSRAELEAAARRVAAGAGAGITVISDIDKTVLPPGEQGAPLPPPYPGVRALYEALEMRDGVVDGDVRFVTGRPAAALGAVPDWLGRERMPVGAIETGRPDWSAPLEEKVADIEAQLAARAGEPVVLFGDSSHLDPEVYREVARRHPDRVLATVIHRVRPIEPDRVAGMWLVDDYAEAAVRLVVAGALTREQARAVALAAQSEGLEITEAQIDRWLEAPRGPRPTAGGQ
ncbi:MAG: DUF2183 domain-containing protein, partial [Planctomycetota bacterium]